ncbi:hypothetical protein AVEN_58014-1, partial [Araneus ventricosus]
MGRPRIDRVNGLCLITMLITSIPQKTSSLLRLSAENGSL